MTKHDAVIGDMGSCVIEVQKTVTVHLVLCAFLVEQAVAKLLLY